MSDTLPWVWAGGGELWPSIKALSAALGCVLWSREGNWRVGAAAAAVRIHLLHGWQDPGTRAGRSKAPCRMSDLCSVFVLLPKQISCTGKLSAPRAGEISLLQYSCSGRFLFLLFSHQCLSDLVFNELSCSRELPQKAIGLNLLAPEEYMKNSSPLAFIHLPLSLLPKRTVLLFF